MRLVGWLVVRLFGWVWIWVVGVRDSATLWVFLQAPSLWKCSAHVEWGSGVSIPHGGAARVGKPLPGSLAAGGGETHRARRLVDAEGG